MDLSESQLLWTLGGLLLIVLLLALAPACTALKLLRQQKQLRTLYWHFVTAWDRRSERGGR